MHKNKLTFLSASYKVHISQGAHKSVLLLSSQLSNVTLLFVRLAVSGDVFRFVLPCLSFFKEVCWREPKLKLDCTFVLYLRQIMDRWLRQDSGHVRECIKDKHRQT